MFSFQWYAYVLKKCIFPYDHLSWFVLTAVSVNQVLSLHRENSNKQDDERDHLVSCEIEEDVRWSFVGKESKAVRGVTLWNPMIRSQLVVITKRGHYFDLYAHWEQIYQFSMLKKLNNDPSMLKKTDKTCIQEVLFPFFFLYVMCSLQILFLKAAYQ